MSKTVESGDKLEFNPDTVGWDDECREVVLVAPTDYVQEMWRKMFPGVKVVRATLLPQQRTRKGKGSDVK